MKSKYDARVIKSLFDRGENIIQWIRSQEGAEGNSLTAITYSYDIQAGSYIAELEDKSILNFKMKLGREIASVLDDLTPQSLLDAGVGEATTLAPALAAMKTRPSEILGFDISLSRLLYAHSHLVKHGFSAATLFLAELDRIPLPDDSVDVVLTIHAVEPNRGQEQVILAELLRVARRHLVMVEPGYELADAEGRAWMDRHGYARGLPAALEALGHPARVVRRWGIDQNPINQSSLIIVDKKDVKPSQPRQFISPLSGGILVRRPSCWFSPEDGHAFPVIEDIPCLTADHAVLASKLDRFY